MSELSLPCSEMNSDTVSIASGFNELEDSIVPKDGRVSQNEGMFKNARSY